MALFGNSFSTEHGTTISRPRPQNIQKTELAEYTEIARNVGFYPSQLTDYEVKNLLIKHHIPIFNLQEVEEYLTSICPRDKVWGWFYVAGKDWSDAGNKLFSRRYNKLIPIHILKRIKLLMDIDSELGFFVSDFAIPNPDPFLLTTKAGISGRVIGMWDEPGFTGNPEVI